MECLQRLAVNKASKNRYQDELRVLLRFQAAGFLVCQAAFVSSGAGILYFIRGRCCDHNFRRINRRFSQKPML
jgi:hypothetical protein